MRASIDGGVAVLELNASELRTLFIAVDLQVGTHLVEAALCEESAESRELMAQTNRHGRVANRRVAGELRDRAAGHKACARDAGDLRRVLGQLTKSPDVR